MEMGLVNRVCICNGFNKMLGRYLDFNMRFERYFKVDTIILMSLKLFPVDRTLRKRGSGRFYRCCAKSENDGGMVTGYVADIFYIFTQCI